jgi:hypothetical protein
MLHNKNSVTNIASPFSYCTKQQHAILQLFWSEEVRTAEIQMMSQMQGMVQGVC